MLILCHFQLRMQRSLVWEGKQAVQFVKSAYNVDNAIETTYVHGNCSREHVNGGAEDKHKARHPTDSGGKDGILRHGSDQGARYFHPSHARKHQPYTQQAVNQSVFH